MSGEIIEEFFKSHEHTVAALEAFSTFLAVVISLYLTYDSRQANRTHIKANLSMMVVLHSSLEGQEKPTYIIIDIKNIGLLPASIPLSFFRWKVPFKSGVWILNPVDSGGGDEWVQQKQYPIEIKPRQSKLLTLQNIDDFREMCRANFIGSTFIEKLRFQFLRAIVLTDDGQIFKVKIDKSVRQELQALRVSVIPDSPGAL